MTKAMDALIIYYYHFGRENNELRKKQYGLKCFNKSIERFRVDTNEVPRQKFDVKFLKRWTKILLSPDYVHDVNTSLRGRFEKFYRNHIYPAELYDYGSRFFGANVRLIDSILIDRDSKPEEHERVRGKYKFSSVFYV